MIQEEQASEQHNKILVPFDQPMPHELIAEAFPSMATKPTFVPSALQKYDPPKNNKKQKKKQSKQ